MLIGNHKIMFYTNYITNLTFCFYITGTEECPVRSVVTRVGQQLHKALTEKGLALLVNHGICDEKVSKKSNLF